MIQHSKNIFLISFEQDTLTNVLECICRCISNTTNKNILVDFYLDGDIEKAESPKDIKTQGIKMKVRSRETNHTKMLYYYGINHDDITNLQPYFDDLKKQINSRPSTSIVYCFNYKSISEGYGSFDKITECTSNFLKFQFSAFMLKNSSMPSYNLVYFQDDYKNNKLEWLSEQITDTDNLLNGTNFSILFNESIRHLEQYHLFLKLPTYLITNNTFIPKIPF